MSDATRYLCVAATVDASFADRVLAEVRDDELRAAAPSVRFDPAVVVEFCLATRRRRVRRDIWLALAGGIAFALSPMWTLIAGAIMATSGMVVTRRKVRPSALQALASLTTMAAITLMITLNLSFGSETSWLTGSPPIALLAGVVAHVILLISLLATRRTVVTRLRRGTFRPAESQDQINNVSVYGGYAPFIGYGTAVTGWSFALPLLPIPDSAEAANRDATISIDVIDLIDCVRKRLSAIGTTSSVPGRPATDDLLPDLVLQDRVFVSGDQLTDDRRFLPDRGAAPRQHLTDAEIEAIARRPEGAARHYLCALVPSWGGEVAASTFLHFSTDGRLLYLECARSVLEPVRRRYHEVDRLPEQLSFGALLELADRAAQQLLLTALGAPFRLIGDMARRLGAGRRRTRLLREAREDAGHNYGALLSPRELAVDPMDYHNYFQLLDTAKHLKIVERHVLASILGFLDERGVDTAEFRTRQTTILNQGIIQSGGLSVVTNQSVGTGARAGTDRATARPAAATSGGQR
ncbi:hypothetical protein AB0M54_44150 [Actinoplanes sp. NPDC051470]|uniref:hypothetical protein n=1 Tax=Actinoplanes sp. NPDC051470 TaxID=3157224 RepID=UPI0034242405